MGAQCHTWPPATRCLCPAGFGARDRVVLVFQSIDARAHGPLAGSRRPALRRASRCQTIHTSGLACAKSGGGKVRTDLAITLPLSPIPRSSPQLPACLFPKWILRSISSLAVCNKALRSAILYNHARLVVACNEIKLEEFHSHEGCKGCWSPIHLLA
jgi:hypothetical protein